MQLAEDHLELPEFWDCDQHLDHDQPSISFFHVSVVEDHVIEDPVKTGTQMEFDNETDMIGSLPEDKRVTVQNEGINVLRDDWVVQRTKHSDVDLHLFDEHFVFEYDRHIPQ